MPGTRARVRVVNTDQGTAAVWASVPYRVVATDGNEVSAPTDVVGQKVLVAAGGRVDLTLVVPDSGAARVRLGGARSLVVGPEGVGAPDRPPATHDARPAAVRHTGYPSASMPTGPTGCSTTSSAVGSD